MHSAVSNREVTTSAIRCVGCCWHVEMLLDVRFAAQDDLPPNEWGSNVQKTVYLAHVFMYFCAHTPIHTHQCFVEPQGPSTSNFKDLKHGYEYPPTSIEAEDLRRTQATCFGLSPCVFCPHTEKISNQHNTCSKYNLFVRFDIVQHVLAIKGADGFSPCP